MQLQRQLMQNIGQEERDTKLKKSVVKVTNELLIISSTAFISIGLFSTSIGKYIVPESYWEALSLIFFINNYFISTKL